jgi:hypothetical protein
LVELAFSVVNCTDTELRCRHRCERENHVLCSLLLQRGGERLTTPGCWRSHFGATGERAKLDFSMARCLWKVETLGRVLPRSLTSLVEIEPIEEGVRSGRNPSWLRIQVLVRWAVEGVLESRLTAERMPSSVPTECELQKLA